MKETKVYVDVEPRKIATQLVDLENEQFNCVILMFDTDVKPIEVIVEPKFKAHDRELVRQVCAKISRFIDKMKGVKFDERKMFVELENLKIEIQKEFEK